MRPTFYVIFYQICRKITMPKVRHRSYIAKKGRSPPQMDCKAVIARCIFSTNVDRFLFYMKSPNPMSGPLL
ncbi:hypothetical protein EDWATA_01601 [Edwardsiella tarda ATCC 23685]|uniref:Uncharacterized protein n=1 Tax=Edwardsiella tarda ATCC 23685 TaxID=500638 RepID=D4F4D0_EDWTA|nr:hypothetical protein EDWATA_01601 [Edwardsiella tarda ATCC 23685]